MLQTMLVSGITPLQDKDEISHWENRPFSGIWAENNNRKTDITRNRTIKKKNKRVRTAFTTDQLRALERNYLLKKYINSENRRELSKELNIGEKCIKIWFQNRRMKEKRESSESSDSSSETFSQEITSPLLVQTKSETQYDQQDDQYKLPYQEPCYYYQSPAFQTYNVDKPQDQMYQLPNMFTPSNNYGNGLTFCNETNLYSTPYPSSESDVNNSYGYQDQHGYRNEMSDWYTNNLDSYNFYQ